MLIKKENITTKFEKLYAILNSENFLKMKGLGNEIPFFISHYHPSQQNEIDKAVEQLRKRLTSDGINVCEVNLYDLCMDHLKAEGDFDYFFQKEQSMEKDSLLKQLKNLLDPQEELMPLIKEKLDNSTYGILFLTGIGLVYPFLRSHTIMNNLQRIAKEKPTVMFFPGSYTRSDELGSSLDLFGLLHDDKYYRAFDINSYSITS